MRRIILNHRKLTYKDYIQTPETMQRLIERGVIKTMPAMAPIKKRSTREYAVKYATDEERRAARMADKQRWRERQRAMGAK
jgi:ribosomal protein L19E